ncbi:Hypothetical predicted protein [Paramuricea clavata]|uniref:Uncharacterized protein n=1 Tax=Paramuricea clavata TaxID=317549 RepID=A0A7D9DD03_PARCT|nr:Hypothetical predicted protein [Paramuricea clavata]
MCSPNVSYSAKDARRKLLQMPLAAVGDKKLGTYCFYLVEKKSHTNYRVFQSLLHETSKRDSKQHMTQEEVKKLFFLLKANLKENGLMSKGSESETDRELTDEVAYLPGSENPKSANDITTSTTSTIRNASSDNLLNILRNSDYNWLEFVNLAQENMKELHETAFQDSISDFYHKLPFLGMSNSDMQIVQQSHQVYILNKSMEERDHAIQSGNIVSESDESSSDNDIRKIQSPFDVPGQFLITKRRDALHIKATRDVKRKIAEQRFLKRRKSADAWRQTGLITFDGNKKLEKKATFKRVTEHLEEKYQRSISYGTVVQLCIARNKRRRSALRYRGGQKVIQKRARKGFNIKYNPDSHWSNALYSCLDALQYRDGTNVVNLGRDDQAGFRLDTLATHRLHGNLCVKGKETLATRTDYVNKYPSTLQTTSYNFPGTETTGEICMGVVKAPVLFSKNSAQHLADLEAISKNECSKPAFINPTTGTRKEIECVRVDGGYDEGPAHLETQYWWTLHHLNSGSHALLVTSRNGGASFRNRVELQNGCLAHSNLFIPSTLNGSCTSEGGNIHLIRGADNKAYQDENELLKVFLKGKKGEKEALERDHPEAYSKFQRIWQLRNNHLHKELPAKYVLYLVVMKKPAFTRYARKEGPKKN